MSKLQVIEEVVTEHAFGTTTSYRVRYEGPSLGKALAAAANDPGPTPDLDIPPDGPETDPRF